MSNYYNLVRGNLLTGEIAKSSDINHIQQNIMDMINNAISDQYDNESFMLGSGEAHKNDFLLYPAEKFQGRYVDDRIVPDATETTIDATKFININRYTVKQPITITKTSIYSVIVKMKNDSNRNIEVRFELQRPDGKIERANTLTVPANTKDPEDFEVVFDLKYYPTAPNLNHEDIKEKDGRDIVPKHIDEESYDEGYIYDPEEEVPHSQFSVGVSQLYLVIKKTDLNKTTLTEMDPQNTTPVDFDPETSLGVFYTESSPNAEKDIYCEIASENIFTSDKKMNIFFKEVYANGMTYLCKGGEAVIRGERVLCLDSHVSIAGGNSYGNMLTAIYLNKDGHLVTKNYKASLATNVDDFEEDEPIMHSDFPVGLIFTYSNIYGIDKEPIVIQSQSKGQLPLSHHERIRRLEKYADWVDEIAIPARLQWTLTGEDLVDKEGANPAGYPFGKSDSTDTEKSKYYLTTDANGNPVVRLSEAVVTTIPITLKDSEKDSDGNKISLEENDIKNASYFSETKDITHDVKTGKITLKNKNADASDLKVALTDKEAKATKYNPWDDDKSNRPADAKFKKKEREFTVYSGKNGSHDTSSEFPAMTLYCDKKVKLTKLTIPIHKFKNCSGIKFYIWKRQDPNNKKNVVNELEKKIWTSKTFSLKKAKVKKDYQYMDQGFTLDFEKDGGLSLSKAQYAIICLPIPKSGEGSCYVETFEPKNPRDFLIRYHGAANASHFTLKTRYHEVWYNSASAEAIEEEYPKKGSVVSKTITWTEEGLKNIETIKPVVGKNLKTPDKTSAKIFADTGGGWQELTPDEDNNMIGGAMSFKWKIEFTSDGKSTPELTYDSKKKYAIQFILTRAKAGTSNSSKVEEKDRNMCITTVPFDGDKILREYIGDPNFALTHSKFNQYEFARIWADENENQKLLIDIQGSDRDYEFKKYKEGSTTEYTTQTYPLWTLHYCDLTLSDFSKMNVDYSHYNEDVEYDENNLRLKLDSNHSYNDNDIAISSLQEFKKVTNSIDSSESAIMTFINNNAVKTNQIFLKSVFDNPKDLTQYTGLIFKFRMRASDTDTLKGLGIYISNSLNAQPTRLIEDDSIAELEDTQVLPPIIDPDTSSEPYYEGKTIKLIHYVDKDNDGNKAYETGYYKYVPQYDNSSNKIIYVLQQIHDVKNYKVYEVGELTYEDKKAITPEITVSTGSSSTSSTSTSGTSTGTSTSGTSTETPASGTSTSGTSTETPESGTSTETPASGTSTETPASNEDSDDDEDKVSKTKYMEITVRVEIDQDSQVLKTVREIGIISLHDESKYSVSGSSISLELEEVKALSEDYYPIFNPEKDTGLWKRGTEYATIYDYNNITLDKSTYNTKLDDKDTITGELKKIKSTSPVTEQVCINYQDMEAKDTQICYMNNPYQGGLSKYKHVGIQMASDVYIPKDCLKLQLCEKENGESPFVSVNLPTLNTVYDPENGDKAIATINLSQIFKKINSDKEIKSINVVATEHFKPALTEIVDGSAKGKHINIFLGKIVVYKAETIPMFHNKMRFKLYSAVNGNIEHTTEEKTSKSISVRKVGTVVDYS